MPRIDATAILILPLSLRRMMKVPSEVSAKIEPKRTTTGVQSKFVHPASVSDSDILCSTSSSWAMPFVNLYTCSHIYMTMAFTVLLLIHGSSLFNLQEPFRVVFQFP